MKCYGLQTCPEPQWCFIVIIMAEEEEEEIWIIPVIAVPILSHLRSNVFYMILVALSHKPTITVIIL